ncbi:hypothetical protein BU198_20505, partial [Streptomyces sp. CBMA156]|nr:hypothetical protein [Streptomyces sp. CBMA156]
MGVADGEPEALAVGAAVAPEDGVAEGVGPALARPLAVAVGEGSSVAGPVAGGEACRVASAWSCDGADCAGVPVRG